MFSLGHLIWIGILYLLIRGALAFGLVLILYSLLLAKKKAITQNE